MVKPRGGRGRSGSRTSSGSPYSRSTILPLASVARVLVLADGILLLAGPLRACPVHCLRRSSVLALVGHSAFSARRRSSGCPPDRLPLLAPRLRPRSCETLGSPARRRWRRGPLHGGLGADLRRPRHQRHSAKADLSSLVLEDLGSSGLLGLIYKVDAAYHSRCSYSESCYLDHVLKYAPTIREQLQVLRQRLLPDAPLQG